MTFPDAQRRRRPTASELEAVGTTLARSFPTKPVRDFDQLLGALDLIEGTPALSTDAANP
ncbi:hypothetical protein [Sphingomonas sp. TZW2008]|uniref:hypothetical protein n=1 Tax=Sphingomonas sp. TZW2008 TaxID=1917973 RepID=UPI000A271A5E|nr:hypothetical protein [Sphingomonas sp. TZW2008]